MLLAMNGSCGELHAGTRRQRDQSDARQILEMVGHKRVAKIIDIEKAEHRQESRHKIANPKYSGVTPSLSATGPQDDPHGHESPQRHPEPKRRRVQSPPRIDEYQG